MTLSRIIQTLDELNDDLVIFATKNREWELNSDAALVLDDDMESIGTELDGLTYFLETSIAKEVLEVWTKWHDGNDPDEKQRAEALIYYAENDAYLPTTSDS